MAPKIPGGLDSDIVERLAFCVFAPLAGILEKEKYKIWLFLTLYL